MGKTPKGEQGMRMTGNERRAALSLAGIYALRMLGLFMILPVFALHASRYDGATAALTGLAIGIYGLTQALFQIPFGMLSDRVGRKRVIVAGLLLFTAGSVLAALADSIMMVIAGRALQGAGAIAAAVLALTADLTREEHRTKAMAVIGAGIGLTFALAMVLGPLVADRVGIDGVFWLTAALAVAGIGVLAWLVPDPPRQAFHRDTSPVPAQFRRILGDPQLARLNLGIGLLHFNMTATFTVLPLTLAGLLPPEGPGQGTVYLGVLVAAVVLMVPFVRLSDSRDQTRNVFLGAIAVLALAQAGLGLLATATASLLLTMTGFFTAFMLLEATLPVLVSRLAPPDLKGTAMGAYSTCQFAGAFLGGALGGWLHGATGADTVYLACAALAVLWLVVAAGMRAPPSVATRLLRVGTRTPDEAAGLAAELLTVPGVTEAVVVAEEGVAYLKVDRRRLDGDALAAYAAEGSRPA